MLPVRRRGTLARCSSASTLASPEISPWAAAVFSGCWSVDRSRPPEGLGASPWMAAARAAVRIGRLDELGHPGRRRLAPVIRAAAAAPPRRPAARGQGLRRSRATASCLPGTGTDGGPHGVAISALAPGPRRGWSPHTGDRGPPSGPDPAVGGRRGFLGVGSWVEAVCARRRLGLPPPQDSRCPGELTVDHRSVGTGPRLGRAGGRLIKARTRLPAAGHSWSGSARAPERRRSARRCARCQLAVAVRGRLVGRATGRVPDGSARGSASRRQDLDCATGRPWSYPSLTDPRAARRLVRRPFVQYRNERCPESNGVQCLVPSRPPLRARRRAGDGFGARQLLLGA